MFVLILWTTKQKQIFMSSSLVRKLVVDLLCVFKIY